ncbi:MAG: DUF2062 domain-containing protein [Crocinitomicaceae bacterium]|nr:DUF2062 domain-containing protein [Crocinitomicaceae bacterium]
MNSSEDFKQLNACVIMPTYNNSKTLERVLNGLLNEVEGTRIIVINDGSTDDTPLILEKYRTRIELLANETNQGKGFSIRKGFKKAIELGFENAVTIDSDGQHFPSDLPVLLKIAQENPGCVVMGSRNMEQAGVPQKSSFGNKFSNFWFLVETGISLPDTQTGYRMYPLKPLKNMRLFTTKFELEIEVIVRLAWKNISFIPVPIHVLYDPTERVSHFRPGRDFFRISVLNSVLVTLALLFYFPRKLFSKGTFNKIKEEAIKSNETNAKKALSIAFGIFMGIFPIWGFQLLIGIPFAYFFRLNKVLFIAAANISIPPMIPFILYTSMLFGQLFFTGEIDSSALLHIDFQSIKSNLIQYTVGAIIFSVIAGTIAFLLSYSFLSIFRKKHG